MSEKNKPFPFGQEIVWRPKAEQVKNSNLQRMIDRYHLGNYDALYQKSIQDIDWFWDRRFERFGYRVLSSL